MAVLIGAAGCVVAAAYGARALDVGRRGRIDHRAVDETVFEDESIVVAD